MALSSDGNTALIGGLGDNGEVGAAWVFTRSGETWTQQGAKLTGSGEVGVGRFGVDVALSSDGNTALIGGYADNASVGAAWVFTRSGSTWTQQGAKLTGSGEIGNGQFGRSVALSSDGNTALIGGGIDNSLVGAAWVFTRSGETWTQQGEKLTGSGASGKAQFGSSVALSSDGHTALIGGDEDKFAVGAAWVFVPLNAPTVVTGAASSVTQTAATLKATVNPNGGNVSECKLEYGTTISYGSSAPCASLPGSGTSPVAVSASVTGLSANTEYHFRISATNAGGTSTGSDQTFKTLPNAPTVVTGAASSVTQTAATLKATVNPNGGNVSECKLEYGTTISYGSSVPCASLPGSGTSPVAVSAAVTGLTSNTEYHFRISATNAGGTSKGSDATFKTLPAPHYYSNAVPLGSEPITVIGWGTLALKTVVGGSGEVVCHTAQAGTIDNPAGAAPGVGSTQLFVAYHCESTACPFTSVVTAESLPWSSQLESEGSLIRAKTTGVKIKSDCQKEGGSEGSTTFVGSDAPLAPAGVRKGSSAKSPGFLEFDAGSGTLEKEGSSGAVQARIEGEVKMLGYEEQELINAKTP